MASFVDNAQALSSFTPYEPEEPIQALTYVGQYKQQQFEQGLQKIQGQIDYVAGLPLVKDDTKKYLNAKLGQLKQAVSTSIASDFSDQRLVNQIGGLTKHIANDPIIESGVQSTLMYQKALKDIEDAKTNKDRKGTYGIENEWDVMSKAQAWLNDGDVNSKFTAQYTPYIDVTKKLTDFYDKLKAIDSTVEIPFQTDAAGNVVLDKTGKPVGYDDAIKHFESKGISKERIMKLFQSSLDENDMNQLRISANYHYRNIDVNSIRGDIINKYNQKYQDDTQAVTDINLKLKDGNLTAVQKANLQSALTSYTNDIKTNTQQRDAELSDVNDSNIDSYKFRLYTSQYLSDLAGSLANQSTSMEYKQSPYIENALSRERINTEYARMRQDNEHFWARLQQDADQFQQRLDFDKTKENGNNPDVPPPTMNLGMNPDVDELSLQKIDKEVAGYDDALKQLDVAYAPAIVESYRKLNPNDNKGNEQIVRETLKKWQQQYLTAPQSIRDNNEREYLQQWDNITKERKLRNNLSVLVSEAAEKKFNIDINLLLSNEQGVNFSNGKSLYTAKEMVEFNDMAKKYTKAIGGSSGTGGGAYVTEFNYSAMVNDFKGTKYEPLAIAYAKRQGKLGGNPTATEKIMADRLGYFEKNYQSKLNNTLQEKNKFISNELAKLDPNYQRKGFDITGNKADAASFNGLIGWANQAKQEGGALDNDRGKNYDPNTVAKWLSGNEKSSVHFYMTKNKDGSGTGVIQLGDEQQVIPIHPDAMQQFFPKYSTNSVMDTPIRIIASSTGKTTNVSGHTKDAQNAYYNGWDLPGLRDIPEYAANTRVDLEGPVVIDDSFHDNPRLQVRLYYYNPKTKVWMDKVLNENGFVNANGALKILNDIGKQTIDTWIANSK